MFLVESRNASNMASFKDALISPNAPLGGLYTPQTLPKFEGKKYANLSYSEFALKLIQSFEFGYDELFKKALKAYECFDDKNCPIKLSKINENLWINELYHGPTRAFKDMALVPFGVLLSEFSRELNAKVLIICATSGDTGPATLKAFENCDNISVACMYPVSGTSVIQALQMRSLDKKSLKTLAINDDFDAAQKMLKSLLSNAEFKAFLSEKNYELCAANSVNFGRILFQIIYHYYASLKLSKGREKADIIVPSGNFGNALGAYFAKKMGAPINMIKIASNENNILSEFFNTGTYDLRGKALKKTISPAMDILISSNIERLLFDKFGDTRTLELMNALKNKLYFKLSDTELEAFKMDFVADFCTDSECMSFIKNSPNLIDPHTATCFKLVDNTRLNIVASTAEWTKFTPSMVKALFDRNCLNEKEELVKLAKNHNYSLKNGLLELFEYENKPYEIYEVAELENVIKEWLK